MNARAARLGMQALALAGVIGLLALLVWKLTHDPGGGVAAQLSQGKRPAAPNFTLPRLDGRGSVELASIKKPRVVDFFASWCYACPHESTPLEKYSREDGGATRLGWRKTRRPRADTQKHVATDSTPPTAPR